MCDDSHSLNHGDSLVSNFSMDRASQRNIETPAQNQHPGQSLIDFEKEENVQRIADLEEQLLEKNAEIEKYQKKIKEQEEDLAKAQKVIKGFRKLVPDELGGRKIDWENVNFDDKNLWAKKLYADLKLIDRNWKSDVVLLNAINNFVVHAGVSETPSVMADRLEADRQKLAADLEGSSSPGSVATNVEESFNPVINANATANIDLVMNGSLMPSDIEQMKATFSGFRNVCTQMFQQLQGTASFLEKLIRSLEDDEDENAKKLLAKIKSIQLDLNLSMQNASAMIGDAHVAEKSLSVALDRSVRLSMVPNSQTLALTEKILDLEKMYAESVKEIQALTLENAKIAEMEAKCEESIKEIQMLRAEKQDFTNLEKLYAENLKKIQALTAENKKLKQDAAEYAEKAANLENVVHDKEGKISTLMEDKKKGEEKSKKMVPEILQEMENIKGTLENVSNEAKKMSEIRKKTK